MPGRPVSSPARVKTVRMGLDKRDQAWYTLVMDRATTNEGATAMEIWVLTVSTVGDEPTTAAYTTEAAAIEEAKVQMDPYAEGEPQPEEEYQGDGGARVFGTGHGDEARVTRVQVQG